MYLTMADGRSILESRVTPLSGPAIGISAGIETLNVEATVRDDRQ
jgi:hypothetical protein